MRVYALRILTLFAILAAAPGAHADPNRGSRPNGQDRSWTAICSLRHPLCVHAKLEVSPDAMLATLHDADRAWDMATGPLALPAPDVSTSTRVYDLYMAESLDGDAQTFADERDPLARFDRASAVTFIDERLNGCARAQAVARGLLRAIAYRVTPGLDAGSGDGQTAYLAHLIAPCGTPEAAARGAFQSHPERAIADAWNGDYARGSSLFYDWMDERFASSPGGLVRALWALSPGMTPPNDPTRWVHQPDTFDVLRASFKNALGPGSTVDDLFLGFATTRATLSDLPRADWEIDWPSKPRRLAPRDPTAPTGSAYVVVRHQGAPAGSRLRVEAAWEEHARMRWTVLKLDANGREMARIPIAASDRATEAQASIVDLDAVSSLVVVGMNAGDFTVPFDPDDGVWEPHGWRLTVAAE